MPLLDKRWFLLAVSGAAARHVAIHGMVEGHDKAMPHERSSLAAPSSLDRRWLMPDTIVLSCSFSDGQGYAAGLPWRARRPARGAASPRRTDVHPTLTRRGHQPPPHWPTAGPCLARRTHAWFLRRDLPPS